MNIKINGDNYKKKNRRLIQWEENHKERKNLNQIE